MPEIWKWIADFPAYEVSDLGRVRRIATGRILKAHGRPYLNVKFSVNGIYFVRSVHRLVAKAFLKSDSIRQQTNHKNGVKSDNRSSNLEWATNSENQRHAYKNGLRESMKGQRHPMAKLSTHLVTEIKREFASGKRPAQVAATLGIDVKAIYDISCGKTWKHI